MRVCQIGRAPNRGKQEVAVPLACILAVELRRAGLRGLLWLIEVRGLAKCIVGANESRPLPPALPKHRTLIGIMRSPSKNNNRRRSYPIGRHLFYVNSRHHYQHQMLHHAASASSISKKQMDSRWRQHGPEMARDAPT